MFAVYNLSCMKNIFRRSLGKLFSNPSSYHSFIIIFYCYCYYFLSLLLISLIVLLLLLGEPGELVGKIASYSPFLSFDGYANSADNSKKIISDCFRKGDKVFSSGIL